MENIIWWIFGILSGVFVSIVFKKQHDELHLIYLLIRKKAVKGSIVSGYIQNTEKEKRRLQESYGVGNYLSEGKDDTVFFDDLKLPYEELNKNMKYKRAKNEIISKALENKYKKTYSIGLSSYRLQITQQKKSIVPIEQLDLISREIDIQKYQ